MSAPLEQGETYQYRQTVTDALGVAANAGTVTATITLPDGTIATPTVVNSATGLYDFDYLTSQAGRHTMLGSATGGVLGTAIEKFDDTFNVEQPGRFLVGFDDARTHLRATTTITTLEDREQLRWLCLTASDAVELDLGLVLARRSFTELFDGGGYALRFAKVPPRPADGGAITIASVTESGAVLSASDYFVRKRGWKLCRGSRLSPSVWSGGIEDISVVYFAGCTIVPPVVRKVVLNTIQTAWQASQQADHPFLDEVARRASLATLSTNVLPSLSTIEQGAYLALKSVNAA